MEKLTKTKINEIKKHAISVFATAFCAGIIAIFQGVMGDFTMCQSVQLDPTNTGVLGAGLKVVHSGITLMKII